eukprot:9529728-Prorocentrum_lima.AAC.1
MSITTPKGWAPLPSRYPRCLKWRSCFAMLGLLFPGLAQRTLQGHHGTRCPSRVSGVRTCRIP